MSLDTIRNASRAAIHAQMALAATARSPDGSVEVPVVARLHLDSTRPFGDLDREGFMLQVEMYSQVIIDRQEWEPERNWILDFGQGRVFILGDRLGAASDRYMKIEVTGKK